MVALAAVPVEVDAEPVLAEPAPAPPAFGASALAPLNLAV